jgi:hypothetical protein
MSRRVVIVRAISNDKAAPVMIMVTTRNSVCRSLGI